MEISHLDWALDYAAKGLDVLPLHTVTDDGLCSCRNDACRDVGKHPRTRHSHKDATTDLAVVPRWWEQWPDANIGGVPASIGCVVLDVDPPTGGLDHLRKVESEHGALPTTSVVLTGVHTVDGEQVRGRHFWFRLKDGETFGMSKPAPGFELKSSGGYVVMPPSRHRSGVRYEWLSQ